MVPLMTVLLLWVVQYFFDPVSENRFRSKKDVFKFLETGDIRRLSSKRKKEDLDGKASAEKKSSVKKESSVSLNISNSEQILFAFQLWYMLIHICLAHAY